MTPEDFALHYHRMRFELECLRRTGGEFQSFFEAVMSKRDPSFVTVKPWGQEGDWKCDGLSESSHTYYQVYAPETLTARQTVAKIDEDFEGAKAKWPDMKRWVFVWSSVEALPPRVISHLHGLRTGNPSIQIEDWGRENLWEQVAGLSTEARTDLLGVVPTLTAVGSTTAAEVQALLNFLTDASVEPDGGDLALTSLGEKLDRNELGGGVREVVTRSLPVARVVRGYVRNHPDIRFSQRVASALIAEYSAVKSRSTAPDAIFASLVDYVRDTHMSSEHYWAAAGIVTFYFELCDVFER